MHAKFGCDPTVVSKKRGVQTDRHTHKGMLCQLYIVDSKASHCGTTDNNLRCPSRSNITIAQCNMGASDSGCSNTVVGSLYYLTLNTAHSPAKFTDTAEMVPTLPSNATVAHL